MSIRSWRALIVLASVVGGGQLVHAQTAAVTRSAISTGAWIVSGSASWDHFDTPNQASSSLAVAPAGLYFFHPRWAFGGGINAQRQRVNAGTRYDFAVGPELRYYDADPSDKTLPFLRAAFRPDWVRIKPDDVPYDGKSRVLQGEVGAGITQLLSSHIGLTGELFYMKTSVHVTDGGVTTSESDTRGSAFGLRFGFTAFVF
ncbi:MAG TPA: hypothetical protein VGM82_04600 [Gemmatimonadaceae bacterium]|jgi:hypothetical protein